jgi:hypothetical protein
VFFTSSFLSSFSSSVPDVVEVVDSHLLVVADANGNGDSDEFDNDDVTGYEIRCRCRCPCCSYSGKFGPSGLIFLLPTAESDGRTDDASDDDDSPRNDKIDAEAFRREEKAATAAVLPTMMDDNVIAFRKFFGKINRLRWSRLCQKMIEMTSFSSSSGSRMCAVGVLVHCLSLSSFLVSSFYDKISKKFLIIDSTRNDSAH